MINNHLSIKLDHFGYIVIEAEEFDKLMNKYLPNSPANLRAKCKTKAKNTTDADIDWAAFTTVTEFLMIMGHFDKKAK